MKSNDSNRLLFKYLILGSFVMFLFILFSISLFNKKSIVFLIVILGCLVLFALIFKAFNKENKKTIDLFKENRDVKVKFASKVERNEKRLYSLNGHCPEDYSQLKKL